jgi:hypothetical protein
LLFENIARIKGSEGSSQLETPKHNSVAEEELDNDGHGPQHVEAEKYW